MIQIDIEKKSPVRSLISITSEAFGGIWRRRIGKTRRRLSFGWKGRRGELRSLDRWLSGRKTVHRGIGRKIGPSEG